MCLFTVKLTQQGEGDSEDEDHDSATQRQQEIAGAQHRGHKQSWVLLLEVLDDGLVLSGPDRSHEDQGHHSSAQKHAKGIKKPLENSKGKLNVDARIAQPAVCRCSILYVMSRETVHGHKKAFISSTTHAQLLTMLNRVENNAIHDELVTLVLIAII